MIIKDALSVIVGGIEPNQKKKPQPLQDLKQVRG
jgi:hypothetical protein